MFTLLASEDFGNGWEHADLGDGRTGLYDSENSRICLLTPPTDMYERSLVALDGTPTVDMWETVLGTRFSDRRQVAYDVYVVFENSELVEDGAPEIFDGLGVRRLVFSAGLLTG